MSEAPVSSQNAPDALVVDESLARREYLDRAVRGPAGRRRLLVLVGPGRMGEVAARIPGLGADFLPKPVVAVDLLAWLRLQDPTALAGAGPLKLSCCTVDLAREVVHRDGKESALTTKEAQLLAYLAARPSHAVSRDELHREVWGYRDGVVTRAVDVAVWRLRSKIEADPDNPRHVITVHGLGYRFEPAASGPTPSMMGLPSPFAAAAPAAPVLPAAPVAPSVSRSMAPTPSMAGVAAPGARVAVAIAEPAGTSEGGKDAQGPQASPAVQEALKRAALARNALVETRGAQVRAAFITAADAIRWCIQSLEESPPGRLRLAIHMAVLATDPGGRPRVTGQDVTTAARLAASAHAGQIVLTQAAWEESSGALGAAVEARPLGPHWIAGTDAPAIRLFQVALAANAGRKFPPLRAPAMPITNLAQSPTSFVGRAADLEHVARLFEGGARVVTLVGPPGIGKSRCAREMGLRVLDQGLTDPRTRVAVWACDLAKARTASDVVEVLADAFGVPLAVGPRPEDAIVQLCRAMGARGELVVVLDNCEQAGAAADSVVRMWLESSPSTRFLATSRERLRIPGEVAHDIGPLATLDATALFVDRARAERRGFEAKEEDAPALGEIVVRLDGNPLAIELAAARAGVLSPAQILERLSHRFQLLRDARRQPGDRHATLRGALDWSWALLGPHEREALSQVSVFAGDFPIEAAEVVVKLDPDAPWLLDVLQALRDKSLLTVASEGDSGDVRYDLYETVRAWAGEKLDLSGKRAEVETRHAEFFLSRVAKGPSLQWLVTVRRDLAAIYHRRKAEEPGAAARAVLALDPVLSARGPFDTHLEMLDGAVEAAERAGDAKLRSVALRLRGRARLARGRASEARVDLDLALECARSVKDRGLEGRALRTLGILHHGEGRLDEARKSYEGALAALRAAGDARGEGEALDNLANLYLKQDRLDEARQHYERALGMHRQQGDLRRQGIVMGNLGALHLQIGETDRARALYERAAELHREAGDPHLEGVMLGSLSVVTRELGWTAQAEELRIRAVDVLRAVGDWPAQGRLDARIGVTDLLAGRTDDARVALERAAAAFREAADRRGEAEATRHLGVLEHEAGKDEDARLQLGRAIALAREIGDGRQEALALAFLGVHDAMCDRLEDGQKAIEQARAALGDTGGEAAEAVTVLERAMGYAAVRSGKKPKKSESAGKAGRAGGELLEDTTHRIPSRDPDLELAQRVKDRFLLKVLGG